MQYTNVGEAWTLYDTVFVTSRYYGQESDSLGWYTSFLAFSQRETHSFFNKRTEATAGLQYCNKQSADSMDYVFHAYSIGLSFFGPGVRPGGNSEQDNWTIYDSSAPHFWEVDLPRHCSISLRVQQDVILELPAFGAPPGYGPCGGGGSYAHDQIGMIPPNGATNAQYDPVLNASVTSGVPHLQNRYKFDKPISIPRTSTIEAWVTVSEIGRDILSGMSLSNYMLKNTAGEYTAFPQRYGMQVTLMGKREVQQRGALHR